MPKTMKVEVRQEHIDKGNYGWSDSCPIAIAIKEELKLTACVAPEYILILRPFKNYDLPKKARKFVKNFDARNPVKPFKFVLRER